MNILSKIREFCKKYAHEGFLTVCVILIAFISYNLGQINALHKTPIKITQDANILNNLKDPKTKIYKVGEKSIEDISPKAPRDQRVVASKSSTSKKYHFTWCSGAKKIKLANQIWFDNEARAQKAGYTLAGNCQ